MKKIGSIYVKGANKENTMMSCQIPTKRKQSIDLKSNCTQASYKEMSDLQIKSTSNQTNSQFSHAQQVQDTLRELEEHTFAENTFTESCFDSLDIYQQKRQKHGILEKLVCLQKMFKEIKILRSLQRNKQFQKELSVIQNSLLSLQRQFIKQ